MIFVFNKVISKGYVLEVHADSFEEAKRIANNTNDNDWEVHADDIILEDSKCLKYDEDAGPENYLTVLDWFPEDVK